MYQFALLLIEPGLTNIGIVLPEAGYLEGLQALCLKYDVIFALDETHTLSAGAGGITARDNLKPDAVVLGKTIGGGVPVGALGFSEELSEKIANSLELESIDVGGVGGTLAGNALSMAAVRATLEEVLTPENFSRMEQLAVTWQANIQATIDDVHCPGKFPELAAEVNTALEKRRPQQEPRPRLQRTLNWGSSFNFTQSTKGF